MSETTAVGCGDRRFWAYDVGLGVLLAVAVEVAEQAPRDRLAPSLDGLVHRLRVQAVSDGSLAFLLDSFDSHERDALLGWVAEACVRLASRGGVSRDEAARWEIVDGRTVDLRGAEHVDAGPLIDLGHAIADLVAGTLPPAPRDGVWCFGSPAGRTVHEA